MLQRFIAIDWGTTNRRTFLVDEGVAVATVRDDLGVLAMAGRNWAAEVAALRTRHGDLPVLIAGMAGSNRGWQEAPYLDCPARVDDLARAILWIEPGRTGIVPGVAVRDPDAPDVMRGEEVQLIGAVEGRLAPADAFLCQPGTHCKWARMQAGAIATFATAMTGELFSILKAHSLLSAQLDGSVDDCPSFRDGVQRGSRGDLASALFGVRAAALLDQRSTEASTAFASGLLIGSDVAARDVAGQSVYILADAALGKLYAAAIEELGGVSNIIDSHAAFVAGIVAVREKLP